MDERARKLLIAGVAVALFVGFIFFTRWSGDEPGSVSSLGDQEMGELEQFCFAINSSFMPYETMLQVLAGVSTEETELPFNSSAVQNVADNLLSNFFDNMPEEYSEQGAVVAEGLERAIDGDLEADDIETYSSAFEDMQEDSADDCEAVMTSSFEDEGPFEDDDFGSGSFDELETETTVP